MITDGGTAQTSVDAVFVRVITCHKNGFNGKRKLFRLWDSQQLLHHRHALN